MSDADLTPATAEDLADALAFALRYSGRKRVHDSGEMMAVIVAKRLVEHLERSGFVERVWNVFPQEHVTVATTYSGWIPAFIVLPR